MQYNKSTTDRINCSITGKETIRKYSNTHTVMRLQDGIIIKHI